MAAFSYQALDAKGKKVKGILEGDSAKQIRTVLRDKGLKPIDVVSQSGKSNSENTSSFSRTKIKHTELALLTRQLATLVESNLPLDEALHACAQQSRRPQVKSLLLDVRAKVLEGHSLGYALGEFPRVFNKLYQSMVKAGEHAGFLAVVLERLADYTENSQHTQQKLKMAMMYPFILMGVSLGVIVLLLVVVVPKMVKIFESQKADLPFLTELLINTSAGIQNYGVYVLGLVIAAFFAFKYLLKDPTRKLAWHRLLLNTPYIGELLRAIDTARFASTLSILMASGVPLLEALKIAGAVLTNLELQRCCGEVAAAVQEGSSLNKALAETEQFPPMMVHMVGSGEASGELESMLSRVAANQERDVEMSLGTVMGLFEPLMLVTMGGFVLMIVIAVLQPIFEMNNMVG